MPDPEIGENKRYVQRKPVIFIPGLKGSVLIDKDGPLWLSVKNVVMCNRNRIKERLMLPTVWHDGVQETDTVFATEIFEKIGPKEFYAGFLRNAPRHGFTVYTFPYDWRRDLNETIDRFKTFVSEVYQRERCPVQLAAHSMGGLIALAAINELPEEMICSTLFTAVPFATGPPAMKHLVSGNNKSHRYIDSVDYFSFPSLFVSLPLLSDDVQLGLIYCKNKSMEPLDVNYANTDDWIKYHFGIFKDVQPTPELIDHLKNSIDSCIKVKQRLRFQQERHYPPFARLSSGDFPTLFQVYYDTEKFELDFDSPKMGPGDTTILQEGTRLPPGYTYTSYESHLDHRTIMNDAVVFTILDALIDEKQNQEGKK